MADDDAPERRQDGTERRVYTLPASLLERLRAFQVSQGISSEAEAARRLLDLALQLRDSIENILNSLDARFAEERDLRVLASEILAKHALVTTVHFDEGEVSFSLRNGQRGRILADGSLYKQDPEDSSDYWTSYYRKKQKPPMARVAAPVRGSSAPPWEPAGDIDDEIPF